MKNSKHKKWVVFYFVMILLILFFILLLNGVFPNGVIKINFPLASANFTATKIKALCDFEKYDTVATLSVKNVEGEYVRITSTDVLRSNLESGKGEMALAIELCKAFSNVRKIDRNKVSESEWEYTYYYGLFYNTGRTYRIVFFDGDWRFVLND